MLPLGGVGLVFFSGGELLLVSVALEDRLIELRCCRLDGGVGGEECRLGLIDDLFGSRDVAGSFLMSLPGLFVAWSSARLASNCCWSLSRSALRTGSWGEDLR